ncbi:MAG: ATP-dependent sacrificial sulfur transferase LarE [Desulfobacterota bacterium]|nr:ATP-dependent sacrificial sulfur transferase LarE [Thermodesulfobacteriota bacterium]
MGTELKGKLEKLAERMRSLGRVAVAFSGGVDSTFLLRMARDVLGKENVLAITALSPLYPERERRAAEALAKEMGVMHLLIESNELEIEGFVENPVDRCYLCKKGLFEEVKKVAANFEIRHIVEGSTLDDEADHRPGKRALRELNIRSPLLEASFTKSEVREASKQLGLPTWEKPSFACLASRFPYGERITEEGLRRVGEAEEFLIGLGFRQVRVRHYGDLARIEVYREEIGNFLDETFRDRVVERLKGLGYRYVTLDLQGFRSGSMNEVLK